MPKFEKLFDMIEMAVRIRGASLVRMGGAVFQIVIRDVGDRAASLTLDLKSGNGAVRRSEGPADVTLVLSDEDFAALVEGRLNTSTAFATSRIKVSGDLQLAQKLGPILESTRPACAFDS